MFVRKKINKSGVISVQIIEKRSGKSALVKTVGSSADLKEVEFLYATGKEIITKITGQGRLYFDKDNEAQLVDLFFNGIK